MNRMKERNKDFNQNISSMLRIIITEGIVDDFHLAYFSNNNSNKSFLAAKMIKKSDGNISLFLNENNSYLETILVLNAILEEGRDKKSMLNKKVEDSSDKNPVFLKFDSNFSRRLAIS